MMHACEDIDATLVARLVAAQFPQWAGLPIEPIRSAGTDNALYRLGEDMVVRLPRILTATGQIERERKWLPRLAPRLPLAACRSYPHRERDACRRLRMALVYLPMAGRRDRDHRPHRRSAPSRDRVG